MLKLGQSKSKEISLTFPYIEDFRTFANPCEDVQTNYRFN